MYFLTVSGLAATRVSRGWVSATTPISMAAPPGLENSSQYYAGEPEQREDRRDAGRGDHGHDEPDQRKDRVSLQSPEDEQQQDAEQHHDRQLHREQELNVGRFVRRQVQVQVVIDRRHAVIVRHCFAPHRIDHGDVYCIARAIATEEGGNSRGESARMGPQRGGRELESAGNRRCCVRGGCRRGFRFVHIEKMRRATTAALSERGYILADGTGSDLRDGLVSPIGGLLAAVQRLVFLQLGLSDPLRGLGLLDLDREFADRALEIVASGDRGPGVGGVSEMMGIADPGALFFVGDFAVEIGGHTREFGDHRFDLANASPLFLDLEAFQPDERVPRFHTNALPHRKTATRATPPILQPTARLPEDAAGKLLLCYGTRSESARPRIGRRNISAREPAALAVRLPASLTILRTGG